ncbi:MAG: sugar phosphate isomerase/epimerase [Xanthomonadales bacterium]|nr:sugar phosphate isomerase/epimerase [Xanthomonadales bacterium]
MITRRGLLGLMGAMAGTTLAGCAVASERRVERIGVQLYTVRDLLSADVPGTLAAVAAAGYVEVETAGYADLSPAAFKQELAQAGLSAPSAHVPLDQIESSPQQLIEAAEQVGHRYLVLPWLTPQQRATFDIYPRIADVMNEFGASCQEAGIQLAYHNHDFEFVPMDGKVPFDFLLERCDRELVKFELDLYWAAKAGVDAVALFQASPGRYPLCHVKDMSADGAIVPVGDGTIDFASQFTAGVTGGLRHYFVEHDNPADPMASIRRSIGTVRKLRF